MTYNKGKFKKGNLPWNTGKKCPQISEALKGHKHTKKSKEKMSLANKGKHLGLETEFKKGQKPWNKGIPCKTTTKNKLSKIFKGIPLSELHKKSLRGRVPWNKGKHHSEEAKEKNRQAHIGIPIWNKGILKSKSHSWKGGISFEPYGIEFDNRLKEFIRKRDSYRCQECFRHQSELKRKLHIHHIDYDKKNNNIENLISLCDVCHGQTNWDRNDWINYFQARRCGKLQ